VIRITGYGVIAEKPRVGKLGQFFRAPCRKNYTLDRKMDDTFYDGHDELYHHAKFGNIVQRAPAVGAKMWCLFCCCCFLFFLCFFCLSRSESGAPCVRGVHSPNTHCVAVYRSISTRFAAFFGRDCTFRQAT